MCNRTSLYLATALAALAGASSHAAVVLGVKTTITGYYVYDDTGAIIKTAAPQDPQQ